MAIKKTTPADNTLAANLRRLRTARKLTQRTLSDASGVTERVLSRIERGHTAVELKTILALARALGVSIIELVPEID